MSKADVAVTATIAFLTTAFSYLCANYEIPQRRLGTDGSVPNLTEITTMA